MTTGVLWSRFRSPLRFLPVFICSYMFLAPVFGYLGDRYNRKYIMSGGITFWSLVTLASSYTPEEVREMFELRRKTFVKV